MWEQEDSLVHAWLLGSMAGERFKNFMFLKTTKGIWDHVHKCSSTRGIDWRVYCLVTHAINLVQGNRTVEEYAADLMAIWIEIDHYRSIHNPESKEWQYVLNDRLYNFLLGLNVEYESV